MRGQVDWSVPGQSHCPLLKSGQHWFLENLVPVAWVGKMGPWNVVWVGKLFGLKIEPFVELYFELGGGPVWESRGHCFHQWLGLWQIAQTP